MTRRLALVVAWGILLSGCATGPSGQHLPALRQQAKAAYDKGQVPLALADYRVLAVHLKDPSIWTRVGNLYALEGHPRKAARAYLRATKLDPQDGQAWYNLGVVRLRIAWATLIEAYNTTPPADPVRKRIQTVIHLLEQVSKASGSSTPRSSAPRSSATPPSPGGRS